MVGRPLKRKTREEKKEESIDRILQAAMRLFYEKGYNETTTRDILLEARILNGSLYNRFRSKEDILIAIVSRSMDDYFIASAGEFGDGNHPVLAFLIPGSILLYIASHSAKAAELIYCASSSRKAAAMFVDSYRSWGHRILEEKYADLLDNDGAVIRMYALTGMLGNLCGCFATGFSMDFKEALEMIAKATSAIIDVPLFDAPNMADQLVSLLESNEIVVFGHRLEDFPDYK